MRSVALPNVITVRLHHDKEWIMRSLYCQSVVVTVAMVVVIAIIFGFATIKVGASVLFGGVEAARSADNFVTFVVWIKFLAWPVCIAAGMVPIFCHVRNAYRAWMEVRDAPRVCAVLAVPSVGHDYAFFARSMLRT